VSAEKIHTSPEFFQVHGNYPNPFNPSTSIAYSIPLSGSVKIDIYNSAGQLVQVLYDAVQKAGRYNIEWRPQNKASGLYLCRISYSGNIKTVKMLLIK
jgi:hypothetical protein